jgi:hypothetical protein
MVRDEYRSREVTKANASSAAGLAKALDIDADSVVKTVEAFNAAYVGGEYNPSILDGVKTTGLPDQNPIGRCPSIKDRFTAMSLHAA